MMSIRPVSRVATLVLVVLIARAPLTAGEPETPPAEAVARVRNDVDRLASAEMLGRSGAGARLAAAYIEDQFRALGLEPLFDGGYLQPVLNKDGRPIGNNVGGLVRGTDDASGNEWILVAAHFDHLGVRGGQVYPGADDNASGVAAMLEAARSLTGLGTRGPRRTIAFVGFDLEERGLVGSRFFVKNPPRPLSELRLFVTVDMLGGSLAGVCDTNLFAMGTEHAPLLRRWVEEAAGGLPIDVGVVGSDLLFFDRSDYGPFRHRKIPYLFLSSGQSPVYHTPDDRPELLDYRKVHSASRLLARVVERAGREASGAMPTWSSEPRHEIGEAAALRGVLAKLVEQGAKMDMKPLLRRMLETQLAVIDTALDRGVMSAEERRRLVLSVQLVLYTAL
jgi:hypothetical protein